MRPEDLNDMLRSESESVEWKRSLGEWKEIVVATAAMASLHGGQICIGVESTGRICGVEPGKGTLEDLANKIAQSTNPRVTPSISSVGWDRKTVVIVSVPENTQNLFTPSTDHTGEPARRTSVYPKRKPCGYSCQAVALLGISPLSAIRQRRKTSTLRLFAASSLPPEANAAGMFPM
jgi:hypothetical protein